MNGTVNRTALLFIYVFSVRVRIYSERAEKGLLCMYSTRYDQREPRNASNLT